MVAAQLARPMDAYRRTSFWLADRQWAFVAVVGVVMLWPVLFNHGPYYFGDSPGYLNGGKLAVDFVLNKVTHLFQHHEDAQGGVAAVTSNVSGVRSVAYSVFASLTRAPANSMLFLVFLQSLLVAYHIWLVLDVLGLRQRPLMFMGFTWATVFLTPAAWFAVLAMPDIFAGLSIVAVALLTAYPHTLSKSAKAVLSATVFFTVCNHLSHPPLVGLLVIASAGILLVHYGISRWRELILVFAWIGPPALAGLVATVAVNAIGFHSPSVSGKHYPIVLASMVQAGPGRWYLTTACKTEHYTICDIYRGRVMPDTSGEFLFGTQGVRHLATPEQMERIRDEEPIILQRTYAAYPFTVGMAAVNRALFQMVRVGLEDHLFGNRMLSVAEGQVTVSGQSDTHLWFKRSFRILWLVQILGSMGLCTWLFWRERATMTYAHKTLTGLTMFGCLVNAAICGAMSAVTDRYQGRVVWASILVTAAVYACIRMARHVTATAPQYQAIKVAPGEARKPRRRQKANT